MTLSYKVKTLKTQMKNSRTNDQVKKIGCIKLTYKNKYHF
jgi:hypothetical protein